MVFHEAEKVVKRSGLQLPDDFFESRRVQVGSYEVHKATLVLCLKTKHEHVNRKKFVDVVYQSGKKRQGCIPQEFLDIVRYLIRKSNEIRVVFFHQRYIPEMKEPGLHLLKK